MTPAQHFQADTAEVSARSASWWLRLGQTVMFVGLLAVAVALSAADGAGWPVYVLAAAMLAVFLTGMAGADRMGRCPRLMWVGVLFVGNIVLMFLHESFLWVAFPLWTLAGAVLPLAAALLLTAVTVAFIVTVLSMTGGETIGSVLGPLAGAGIALGLSRGVLQFEHEAAEHRRLLNEVLLAQDETARLQREAGVLAERTRLAHDIHDTLAQGFSSLVLLARAARRDPAQAADLLATIEQTASDNLAESRRVIYALAADDAGAGGLAGPLRLLARETAEAIGAEATVVVDPDLPRLATPLEVALLRAAQGTMANIRQHSDASRIAVELARSDSLVLLDIVDDGVGFDPTQQTVPTMEGGYGLRALRERLAELGGGMAIESEPGGGTAVSVHLPIVKEQP